MTANEPQPAAPQPKLRWYRVTPDRLVLGLLAVEGVLLLSEWFNWFAFNGQTWTVLIALAAVGLTLFLTLLWFIAALLFRWRFQYRLRSLLLLVVAVAIPCSWVAVEMKHERTEKAAAEEIGKLAGSVQPERTWLGRLLRDDSLATVESVGLLGANANDVGLVHLEGLSQLRSLWLNNSEITDAGLAHLEGLSQLHDLRLDNTKVTDAGLEHLEGLRQLQDLSLCGTQVTDAGLAHLEGSRQLHAVYLGGTKVTDEGVRKLHQALPECLIFR